MGLTIGHRKGESRTGARSLRRHIADTDTAQAQRVICSYHLLAMGQSVERFLHGTRHVRKTPRTVIITRP